MSFALEHRRPWATVLREFGFEDFFVAVEGVGGADFGFAAAGLGAAGASSLTAATGSAASAAGASLATGSFGSAGASLLPLSSFRAIANISATVNFFFSAMRPNSQQ